MLASVIKIGNSRGVRLPKNILHELNIEDKVEMTVNNESLIIKKAEKKPRKGWEEEFSRMSGNKEDKLILPENTDSENFEWVW